MKQTTKFDDGTWKTELRKISDLKPNPKNPRTITKDTIKPLRQSMRDNGYTDRIMIDNHNMILSGHARWLVFKEEDPNAEIECLVAQRELTEEEKQRAIIGLNRDGGIDDITALQMDFDPVILAQYDITVDKSDEYNTKEIEEVEIPEDVETRVQPGEIWALGDHRLMCGDSTNPAHADKLMADKRANLVLTDPPYNMHYTGAANGKAKAILNDNMPEPEFQEFLTKFYKNAHDHMAPGATIYAFYKEMGWGSFMKCMKDGGLTFKQELIWAKDHLVLGGAKYQNIYEPFLMGCKGDSIKTWNGGRKQTSVLEGIDLMSHEDLLKAYKELIESIDTDIVREERTKKNDLHSTMKPIKLLARLIRNSSDVGDIVADFFAGSGSTLIAAEQTGRICYCNELDPAYCSVILQRYINFTGKSENVFRLNPDGTKTPWSEINA